jgi:hypothetical protein
MQSTCFAAQGCAGLQSLAGPGPRHQAIQRPQRTRLARIEAELSAREAAARSQDD